MVPPRMEAESALFEYSTFTGGTIHWAYPKIVEDKSADSTHAIR
jgi:hypothetical protein